MTNFRAGKSVQCKDMLQSFEIQLESVHPAVHSCTQPCVCGPCAPDALYMHAVAAGDAIAMAALPAPSSGSRRKDVRSLLRDLVELRQQVLGAKRPLHQATGSAAEVQLDGVADRLFHVHPLT